MSTYKYNLGLELYATANTYAERTALRYPDGEELSYTALNSLSNQWGRYLKNKGLRKGDVIAIFNEKSLHAYALMLACLKTGVIYTNLDITSPWARVQKILTTCEPALIFMDQEESPLAAECRIAFPATEVVNLQSKGTTEQVRVLDGSNLTDTAAVHGGDPAYIMFTSGSTGFPKGAVMSHNNVLNFIKWGKQTFEITEDDVFTNANPIYFDNSVFDFYVSVFNGATLVPLGHELVKNARQLVQTINQSRCTIWFSVPSLLVYLLTTRALSKDDFTTVRRISFGGEGFPKNKLKQLYEMFGSRITMYNVYGPTECTCICSSHIISDSDFVNMNELATLGYISPNFGYEILPLDAQNPNLGELALAGPCVGLGYYNDEERSRKSFVQNPFKKFDQRIYKTGDIVERAANGHLFFKGRVDNQIKHMGYRIELEEIEAAFSMLGYIDECGVIYERISPELGHIKAFVSVSDKTKNDKQILQDIKGLLPPYMIPRIVLIMDILPKNANGKIDRKQLTAVNI
jgi:D-alanine--poly(phosphoribitol) ligase subunit 1